MPNVIAQAADISAASYLGDANDFMRQMFGDHSERGTIFVNKWLRNIVGHVPSDLNFHDLGKGVYFVTPKGESIQIEAPTDFAADMSCEAAGIAVCLYAYSHLAYELGQKGESVEHLANRYFSLRCYAVDHPESSLILASID